MRDFNFEASFQQFIGIGVARQQGRIALLVPFVMIEISWRSK
jgi:hypothetical protein